MIFSRGKRVRRRIETGKNGLGLQPKILFPPSANNVDDDEWEDEDDDDDEEMPFTEADAVGHAYDEVIA